MIVQKITLTGGATIRFEDIQAGLRSAANGDCRRIAFIGRTNRGLSGIAIDTAGRVSGHKIDPLPEDAPSLLWNVDLDDVRSGLRLAAAGEDVLFGDSKHGLALKWVGNGIEVFGAGDDSVQ